MEPSCPLGTTRCIPHENFPRKPHNKSFIDQVCSVKMVGYWPRFFCEFMDLDFFWVHKHAKKELGQYPAILTSHLVNNPYIYTPKSGFHMPPTYLGRSRRHGLRQRYGVCEHLSPTHNMSQALTAGLPTKLSRIQLRRQEGGRSVLH